MRCYCAPAPADPYPAPVPAAASTLAVMSDLADNKVTVKGSFTAILTGRDFE